MKENFKFKTASGGHPYHAEMHAGTGTCTIRWYKHDGWSDDGSILYSLETVGQFLRNGDWVEIFDPIPIPANGVDAKGKPFNFTDDMFEVNQRVVTANRMQWIVMTSIQNPSGLVAARSGGWIQAQLAGNANGYEIVEVYAPPKYNYQLLENNSKGELLWLCAEKAAEKAALEAQIKELQNKLAKL